MQSTGLVRRIDKLGCGEVEGIKRFKGKNICSKCMAKLKEE